MAVWIGAALLTLAVILLLASAVRWALRLAVAGIALVVIASAGVAPDLSDWLPSEPSDGGGSAQALPSGGWRVRFGQISDAERYTVQINGVEVAGGLKPGSHVVQEDRWASNDYAPGPVRDFTVIGFDDEGQRVETIRFSACAPVVILAARGTGEDPGETTFAHGVGSRSWRMWHYLARQLDALPAQSGVEPTLVTASPVHYPAALFSAEGTYTQSRNLGRRDLTDLWQSTTKACLDSTIIVAGYSQGADVVASVWQDPKIPPRGTSGVVLFADPHFNKQWVEQGIVYPAAGTFEKNGILGPRPLFPQGRASVVQSWCWPADPICQALPRPDDWHGDAYNCYEEWAAYYLARQIRPALRNQGYAVHEPQQPRCILDARGR